MTTILGISAFYHDSAATILVDGKIVAAAQEDPEDSQPINSAAATANAIPVNLVFICVFTIVILLSFNLGLT